MLRTISSVLFGLVFCFTIASCEKEYSAEGGALAGGGTTGGTAVFTLEGAPGECLSPFISGSYTAGTSLGAANIVLITANVTTTGTYTITSNEANGVTFSGSGTFSSTGLQTLELKGTGTPAAAGSFNYKPGLNSCSFVITYSAAGSGGSSSGTAVFSLKGAPTNCTPADIAGSYVEGTALGAGNTVTITAIVTTAGTYSITTGQANGVTFKASGNLAAGEQQIILQGEGTPESAATLSYVPGNGSNACSFSITFDPAAGGGTDFLRCTIGTGTSATNFNENLTGSKLSQSGFNILDLSGGSTAGADFSILLTSMSAFAVGDYNALGIGSTKFCLPTYIDEGGTGWTTRDPTQTNNFKVTITAITASRVTGTFSGTLYLSSGPGTTTLAISNGSFSIPYM